MRAFRRISGKPAPSGGAGLSVSPAWLAGRGCGWACGMLALAVLLAAFAMPARAQGPAARTAPGRTILPPRVIQAQRFLAERGWAQGRRRLRSGAGPGNLQAGRSEERRVGKECRSRWSPYP